MTVSCVGRGKIKVTLNFYEGLNLFGETDFFSLQNPSVKAAFKFILKKIKYESPYLKDCSKVYIDLYKSDSGGFVLYLTKGEESTKSTFFFDSVDNMLDALSYVKRTAVDYRVFSQGGNFYLEIDKSSLIKLSPHIEEFCGKSVI